MTTFSEMQSNLLHTITLLNIREMYVYHIKMNTRWFNKIMCYNYITFLYISIEEHNNEISPQPLESYVLANGDQPASPTTSSVKSRPDSFQPSTSGIQSGSGRPFIHELGYSLQLRYAYDVVKFIYYIFIYEAKLHWMCSGQQLSLT